jgi:hypothetical protein
MGILISAFGKTRDALRLANKSSRGTIFLREPAAIKEREIVWR